MNEFEQDIRKYLLTQFRTILATNYWLKGYVCLRCHEYGILTVTLYPNLPWCPLCGRDPLTHGPGREEFRKIKKLYFSDNNKYKGVTPQKGILDELLGMDLVD